LRYYEGLEPDAIARKLAVPGSTVRNRLSRALGQLRERLDREYDGGRGAWSVLLVPTLSIDKLAAGVGWTMNAKLSGAAVAAVVATLLWTAWRVRDERSQPALAAQAAVQPSLDALPQSKVESAPQKIEPANAERDATPTRPVEHVLVTGALLGAEGKSIDNESLQFEDSAGVLHAASVTSTKRYSIFGLKPGPHTITMWARGFRPVAQSFTIPDGNERVTHDIQLVPALVLPTKFERLDGTPIEIKFGTWQEGLGVVATRERVQRLFGVYGRTAFRFGCGLWYEQPSIKRDESIPRGYSGALEIVDDPPLYASCVLRDTVVQSVLVRGDEHDLVFKLDEDAMKALLGAVKMRVVEAETGAAIANASVTLEASNGGGGASGRADADGLAIVSGAAPGVWRMEITAKGHVDALRCVRVEPGKTNDVGTIELARPSSIHVRTLDAGGKPVSVHIGISTSRAGARPEEIDSRWSLQSDEDGRLAHDFDPRNTLILVTDEKWAREVRAASAAEIEIRLERGVQVTFRALDSGHGGARAVLIDPSGLPLDVLYVADTAQHLRLRSGHYELRIYHDEDLVRTQPFDVGAEALAVEYAAQ
jgi:hypothetical protein